MSYTMGTIIVTGSWGTGIRWVSCNWGGGNQKPLNIQKELRRQWTGGTAGTYKEKHLRLEYHSNGPRRSNGGSTGRDGETKLDVPFKLASLVRVLQEIHRDMMRCNTNILNLNKNKKKYLL